MDNWLSLKRWYPVLIILGVLVFYRWVPIGGRSREVAKAARSESSPYLKESSGTSGRASSPSEPYRMQRAPGPQLLPGADALRAALDELALAGTNEPMADERVSLLRRWASLHPREAATWAEALPEGPVKLEALHHVAICWAERDPDAALDWAALLKPGETREPTVLAVGYEAARDTPLTAIKAAGILGSGSEHNQLVLYTVSQWAAVEPVAALEWVEGVKEGGLRDELFADIAITWAKVDGESAALLTTRAIQGGDVSRRAVVSVAQRWGHLDPARARAWIDSIQDAPLRSNCLDAVQVSQ